MSDTASAADMRPDNPQYQRMIRIPEAASGRLDALDRADDCAGDTLTSDERRDQIIIVTLMG